MSFTFLNLLPQGAGNVAVCRRGCCDRCYFCKLGHLIMDHMRAGHQVGVCCIYIQASCLPMLLVQIPANTSAIGFALRNTDTLNIEPV